MLHGKETLSSKLPVILFFLILKQSHVYSFVYVEYMIVVVYV